MLVKKFCQSAREALLVSALVIMGGFLALDEAAAQQSTGLSIGYNQNLPQSAIVLSTSTQNLIYGLLSNSSTAGSFLKFERVNPDNSYTNIFSIDHLGNITTTGQVLGSNNYWKLSGSNLFASTTSWNVGIGTSSPATKLHVSGGYPGAISPGSVPTVWVENSSVNYLGLYSPDANNSGLVLGSPSDGFGSAIYWNFNNKILNIGTQSASGILSFGVDNNVEAARILANGSIGIGTSTPATKLHIYDAASGPILTMSGLDTNYRGLTIKNSTNTEQWFTGNNALNNFVIRRSGTTDYLTVASNGNIGIGLTNPAAKLDITNTTGTKALNIYASGSYGAVDTTYGVYVLNDRGGSSNGPTRYGGYFEAKGYSSSQNSEYGLVGVGNKTGGYSTKGTGVLGIGRHTFSSYSTTGADLVGVQGQVDFTDDSSTLANSGYGASLYTSANVPTNKTLATYYGLYMAAPTGAGTITNRYGIYQADSGTKNYFASNVGIGNTNPQRKLHVAGQVQFDNSGTYTTYSWTGSTVQTNSLEIMDKFGGTTSDGIYPTLIFHDYGNGGAQFSMEGSTKTLHLAGASSNTAGTLQTGNSYFSKLKIWGTLDVSGGTGNVINTGGGQISGLPAVQTEDGQAVSRKYLHDNFIPTPPGGQSSLTGNGTGGYHAKWAGTTSTSTLINSIVYDNGTNVGIGVTNPVQKLQLTGNALFGAGNYYTGAALQIQKDFSSTSGTDYAMTKYITGTGSGTATQYAEFTTSQINGNHAAGYGTYSRTLTAGNGVVLGSGYGVYGDVYNNNGASSTIMNAYGVYSNVNSQDGVINNGYGLYANLNKGTGSMGTAYGLYINLPNSVASTQWGLYLNTSANNYLGSGNVGINTLTPNTKLTVAGNMQMLNTAAWNSVNTSLGALTWQAAARSETFSFANIEAVTDSTTWYRGHLVFKTNNSDGTGNTPVERVRITAAGRVGIGTSNPRVSLDFATTSVEDKIHIAGGFIGGLDATPERPDHAVSLAYVDNNFARIGSASKWASSSNNIYNLNPGNVGINESSPQAPLTIRAASTADQALYQAWRYQAGSDTYSLKLKQVVTSGLVRYAFDMINNGTAYNNVLVLDRGSVGIGTTAPGGVLDVQNNNTGNVLTRIWNTNTSGTGSATLRISNSGNNNNGARLEFADANYYVGTISGDRTQGLVFRTSSNGSDPVTISERMRITSNGNLGLGVTNPATKLHVGGASRFDGVITEGAVNGRIFRNLATFYNTSSGPGAIVIQTAVPQDDHTFTQMGILIYGLTSEKSSCKIVVGGYWSAESNGGFSALGYNSNCPDKYQIRVARQISSGNVAVILQDVASTWSYPLVSVTDFMATYGINDNYANNWTIGFSTDLSGYTNFDTVPDKTVLGGLVRSTVSGYNYFTGGNVGIGRTDPTRAPLDFASSTNDQIHVAGGQIAGLNSIPTRRDHAVPLSYLQDNYTTTSTNFWQRNNTTLAPKTITDNVAVATTTAVGKLFVGPYWRTSHGGDTLYVGSGAGITNTNDLGITYSVSDTSTVAPGKVGLTLYNDDTTAGGWSPLLLFSKSESGSSPYKATMAGIAAQAPLGTGNGDSWIDGELHFYTSGAATNGLVDRMVINKDGYIGIGTSSPITKLHLYDASSGPLLSISGLDTNYRGFTIKNIYNVEQWFAGNNSSNNFVVRRSGTTDYLTIASNGNMVIAGTLRLANSLYKGGGNRALIVDDNGNVSATSTFATLIPVFVGATSASYNGTSNGNPGYAYANSLCAAAFTGSHVCTSYEILNTINTNGTMPSADVWVHAGPPGYTALANDCDGRRSGAASSYGTYWQMSDSSYSPHGRGLLLTCNNSLKYACCK